MSTGGGQVSLPLVSAEGTDMTRAPSEQDTDEFEIIDHEQADEDCSEDDFSISSTSVTSSVFEYEFEHGRRYHTFKRGRYPLPNDIGEQRHEQNKHELILKLMNGKLFLSDIGETPKKIFDIGTGTGTWARDVAELYPSATVVGTDLSPIQPGLMPINARMFVEDCEDPDWTHGFGIDLVHFREIAGVLIDRDTVVANAYSKIVGGGWVEFQDFGHSILCDDGTMEKDDPVRVFYDMVTQGMRRFGCTAFGRQDLARSLRRAGFIRIQIVTLKVPIGSWAKREKWKRFGSLMKTNIEEALDGYAAKPLVALGMTLDQRNDIVAKVQKSLTDDRIHRYIEWQICCGQKRTSGSMPMDKYMS